MQELFDLFHDAVNLDKEMADLAEFLDSDRPTTFAAWSRTAELAKGKLAALGCELADIYNFEALGKDPYGDWPPIRSWDITASELWLVDDSDHPVEKLTSYPENFCATMMYSAPTPPQGVTEEVV